MRFFRKWWWHQRWLPFSVESVPFPLHDDQFEWIHCSGDSQLPDKNDGSWRHIWPWQVLVPTQDGRKTDEAYYVVFKSESLVMRSLLKKKGHIAVRVGPRAVSFAAHTSDGRIINLRKDSDMKDPPLVETATRI